jgi:hypothetical protein
VSTRIRFHPAVADDLDAITRWLIDYAGPQSAARRLDEIEATIASLAFTVDDDAREVHIHAVTYAGADWITRSKSRGR